MCFPIFVHTCFNLGCTSIMSSKFRKTRFTLVAPTWYISSTLRPLDLFKFYRTFIFSHTFIIELVSTCKWPIKTWNGDDIGLQHPLNQGWYGDSKSIRMHPMGKKIQVFHSPVPCSLAWPWTLWGVLWIALPILAMPFSTFTWIYLNKKNIMKNCDRWLNFFGWKSSSKWR